MTKTIFALAMLLAACTDATEPTAPDAGAAVDCGVVPEQPFIAPPTMTTFDDAPIVLVFASDWTASMAYQDALLVWAKCQAHNASL